MKKQKMAKVPIIYQGLTTDKSGTQLCVVIDKHGEVFKFDTASTVTIVKDGIYQNWANFDTFSAWADKNHADFCRIHNQVFKANVPEGTDTVYAHVYLWKRLIQGAKDRTSGPGNPANLPTNTAGNQGNKRAILTRLYFLGAKGRDQQEISLIKTPQAKACFRILCETLAGITQAHVPTQEGEMFVPSVTEEQFKRIIYERQGELHTRQDAWRIFQYYRPVLLQSHLIRHD